MDQNGGARSRARAATPEKWERGAGAVSGHETKEQIKEGPMERVARILNAIQMFFKRAREEWRPLCLPLDGWTGLWGMTFRAETGPHEAPLGTRVTFCLNPHLKNVKETLEGLKGWPRPGSPHPWPSPVCCPQGHCPALTSLGSQGTRPRLLYASTLQIPARPSAPEAHGARLVG